MCDSKYSNERLQGQCKIDVEFAESDIIEKVILWKRVEGGIRKLENHVQNSP